MNLTDVIDRLEERRQQLERLDAYVSGVALCQDLIMDLRAVIGSEENSLYTLKEAAARCNLSRDHIGRLVSQGKIPNAGRKGAPRIRGADLPNPKLRRSIATSTGSLYDPVADARKLGSRQKGGP